MEPKLLVLDGGMGHLLKAKGVRRLCKNLEFEELFAATAMANEHLPELVQEVHAQYIDAGADVITTNSFGCTEWSLAKVGRPELALPLTEEAGKLAREAADCAGREVLVAGCLPPQQESYQVEGLAPLELLQPLYHNAASALAPHVDLLLCETVSGVQEGLAAATAASVSGKPWWISFSLEDNESALLRSGEALQDAVEAVRDLPGLEALLVNCCAPAAVRAALPVLHATAPQGVRIGGYANGFQTTTTEWLRGSATAGQGAGAPGGGGDPGSSGGAGVAPRLPAGEYDEAGVILPGAFAVHAVGWVRECGATVVGGCCGTGPEHIRELRRQLGTGAGADETRLSRGLCWRRPAAC